MVRTETVVGELEVDDQLKHLRMGLTVKLIHEALSRAEEVRRETPRQGIPRGAGGRRAYDKRHEALLSQTRPFGVHELHEHSKMLFVNQDGDRRLMIDRGDKNTGRRQSPPLPTTFYKKGPVWRCAVEGNLRLHRHPPRQCILFEDTSSGIADELESFETWALLYDIEQLSTLEQTLLIVRSEVSLPVAWDGSRPCDWEPRIILPELRLQFTAPSDPFDGGLYLEPDADDDLDVPLERVKP